MDITGVNFVAKMKSVNERSGIIIELALPVLISNLRRNGVACLSLSYAGKVFYLVHRFVLHFTF